ncbi:MAG: thioredoxin domain-containing protein [Myxococcota bacterium]
MGFRCVLLLLLAQCRCGSATPENLEPEPVVTVGDPNSPGVARVDEALVQRLAAALGEKGDDYVPRTEHLLESGAPRYTNRLILETSPYLLQHAHNPVNWFAWGEEAFERARAENKPVLLSVGYSTCHWCHVMERESFEDEEIAGYINAHFIPIKVDREERPDIDDLYMSAVHRLTGRGGWPMTVVMTPDRDPFFGGTYFPPRDGARGSRQGFLTILRELDRRYREEPAAVVAEAQGLSQQIQAMSAPRPPSGVPDVRPLVATARWLARSYDERLGGFGRAPKFPQPSRVLLLLRYHRRTGDARALEMASATLRAMAAGGMYDHVGGGFHRYSTDARWLVPHFEKMLYDNAQLAVAYLEGWQASGDADFARVARETLDYVAREMTAPHGGFYSATDADSRTPGGELEEGWFFTWTPAELRSALGDTADDVIAYYGVTPRGNFEGRSILFTPRSIEVVAEERGTTAAELRQRINAARETLWEVRGRRPPPLRDDKILAGWNGLMISAFARGALVLGEARYAAQAERAADFLLRELRDDEGRLMRSHLGRARHRAYLPDYAFLIAGLLDLYEATGNARWADAAIALQEEQDAHFLHAEGGGYWMTAHDAEELIARDKPSSDGAIPSGNSLAVDNLLRLAELRADDALRERAEGVLGAFGSVLRERGPGLTRMLAALDRYHDAAREIVLAYEDTEALAPFLAVLRETYLPNRVVVQVRGSEVDALASRLRLATGKRVQGEGVTAYVCERGRCEQPTSDPEVFRAQLSVVRPLAEPAPSPL